MKTKKDLANQFGISLNTVRETLKACGLDTSKAEYTEEEVSNSFAVARTMLKEEQKSYSEVAETFGVVMNDELSLPSSSESPSSDPKAVDPLQAAIQTNVQAYVQDVTDQAMEDVIANLPQMIYESAQKLVKSGAIDNAFRKMLENRRTYPARDIRNEGTTIDITATAAPGLPFISDDDEEERH